MHDQSLDSEKAVATEGTWTETLCLFSGGHKDAGQGRTTTGQGRAGQGRPGQARAGQGRAGQGRTGKHQEQPIPE